ncbi:MAG: hypothetical protein DWB42_16470 [Chloroflexi bacterium]|nr:hypothetical protein [Chloroflexota bacterium]MDL1884428.1 hypothetical protein [Anaerolineae bacterium CFX8]
MRLDEYQWSYNPRGMHNEGAYRALNLFRYKQLQLGWMKLVCGGEEFVNDCQWLLSNNITPVIRIYRATPGAEAVDQGVRKFWETYRRAGALWFEFYNEPNLNDPEWPENMRDRVHYSNLEEVIRPLCDNWLIFAEFIVSIGAYPGFPSLSETHDAIQWLDAMLIFLRDNRRDRFINVMRNGGWAAVHPYTLNHFYQEVPGQPTVPRMPAQQNGAEGGWHFEYPYDPYTQSFDPGRTVFGSPAAPMGDPNGLIAMGTAFNQRLKEWFDLDPVPAVGTEGGIYPLPIHESQQPDARFPPYTRESHGEATAAMFNWMATQGPDWLFGLCLWKEDEYYNNFLPAVPRMEQIPQIPWRGQLPEAPVGRGPGPVHGEPTFHAVVLAPGLEPRWFFETARAYWNQFRPMVTTTWSFIEHIPSDRSLAVTVIAPPDMAEAMRQAVQQPYPNVLFDLVVAEGDLQSVVETFNARVWSGRRFG